jgi:hypothetical protein
MKEFLTRSLTYTDYIGLIDRLLSENKTTGDNQSDVMVGYGQLNRARMRRLDNSIEIDPAFSSAVASLDLDMIWLVITEGWCGDAAQNIPVIEKVAAANPGIETRYILRDENSSLMDKFLTNGARSIPKLIAIDRQSCTVIGTWGPRPAAAQHQFEEQRSAGIDKPLLMENLQRWYHRDRGRSLQAELVELAAEWSQANYALAA